jgi:hypothetical protein
VGDDAFGAGSGGGWMVEEGPPCPVPLTPGWAGEAAAAVVGLPAAALPAAVAAAAEQATPAWSKAARHGSYKQPVGDDAFGAGSGGGWMVDDVAAAAQAADPALANVRERDGSKQIM